MLSSVPGAIPKPARRQSPAPGGARGLASDLISHLIFDLALAPLPAAAKLDAALSRLVRALGARPPEPPRSPNLQGPAAHDRR